MFKRLKSHFRPSMTQNDCIWHTVNRCKLVPLQLQDEIDYSASSLKRAGLDGESGAGLNIRKLLPLMKAQDDYTILEHLTYHCGCLLIPFPRGGRSKKDRMRDAATFQSLTAEASTILIQYVNGHATLDDTLYTLHKLLKGTAEVIKEVEAGDQIEMDLKL